MLGAEGRIHGTRPAWPTLSFMARILIAFPLVLLAACASSQQWTKPGADPAALSGDLEKCRVAAQETAARSISAAPPPSMDPRFGNFGGPSLAEQRMNERIAEDKCMRA